MQRIAVFATFAIVALTVWIGGHVFMFDRLVRDPGLTGAAAGLATALLVALCASVLLQPAAERWLPPRWARLVIWPAATWIGFAFYLALSLGASEVMVGLLGAAFPVSYTHLTLPTSDLV